MLKKVGDSAAQPSGERRRASTTFFSNQANSWLESFLHQRPLNPFIQ